MLYFTMMSVKDLVLELQLLLWGGGLPFKMFWLTLILPLSMSSLESIISSWLNCVAALPCDWTEGNLRLVVERLFNFFLGGLDLADFDFLGTILALELTDLTRLGDELFGGSLALSLTGLPCTLLSSMLLLLSLLARTSLLLSLSKIALESSRTVVFVCFLSFAALSPSVDVFSKSLVSVESLLYWSILTSLIFLLLAVWCFQCWPYLVAIPWFLNAWQPMDTNEIDGLVPLLSVSAWFYVNEKQRAVFCFYLNHITIHTPFFPMVWHPQRVVVLDALTHFINSCICDKLRRRIDPKNLIYIKFTCFWPLNGLIIKLVTYWLHARVIHLRAPILFSHATSDSICM